ncbi:glycosyltransferase [Paenibacillus wynnii]|uniref:glycosyltransferase n=1 Tax=Paenibacillus wynnii TaxID=268407 RepID=UPI00278DD41D|nr:glycosyltransferase [Paenibacillus wynnii]MDQ0196271.1 hypothetical protein [Paenibacillus wynnii]
MDVKSKSVKGLYIAFEFEPNNTIPISEETNGIVKKIRKQIESFENKKFSIDFWNPYSGRKHSLRRIMRRLPFYFLNSWKFDYSKASEYSFIYIRKAWFMDGDLIRFLKKFKNYSSHTKILLEIPTYPYDNEGKHLNILPLIIKDKIWRRKLHHYVDRIITYSNDEVIFDVETIQASNAIDLSEISPRNFTEIKNKNVINLIACSSLYYWHGYDRVIKGLNTYYTNKKNHDPIVRFHIVGEGEEAEKYREMISTFNLSDYVYMYGKLSGRALDEVYDISDIGLDSMGRHRSGVYYNSSLKGKEYCAKGLPIVSGVSTDLDGDTEYSYYLRVPAEDKEVDIYDIINFYNAIYKEKDPKVISVNIRDYAKQRFDFPVAMREIIEFITT